MTFANRAATTPEVAGITTMINAAYAVEEPWVLWERTTAAEVARIVGDGRMLVACDDAGQIAGCVAVHCDGAEGSFGMLAVAPERQGEGVGPVLVRGAEDWLREQGAERLTIEVIEPRGPALVPWYERLGYELAGRAPFPEPAKLRAPIDMLVLARRL